MAAEPEDFHRQVTDYLGGVNSPLAGVLGNLGVVLGTSSPTPRASAAPSAAPAGDVESAEEALGFACPPALRQLYLEVADGGVGPGGGIFSLSELVSKHRDMTDEPVGPQGQAWPTDLLPIQGDDWDLVCLDRLTGRLVIGTWRSRTTKTSRPTTRPGPRRSLRKPTASRRGSDHGWTPRSPC